MEFTRLSKASTISEFLQHLNNGTELILYSTELILYMAQSYSLHAPLFESHHDLANAHLMVLETNYLKSISIMHQAGSDLFKTMVATIQSLDFASYQSSIIESGMTMIQRCDAYRNLAADNGGISLFLIYPD